MPKEIAIDIVLIPPGEISQLAIDFNRKLVEKGDNRIILNPQNSIPHISLAYGFIEEGKLLEVQNLVKEIVEKRPAISLKTTSIQAMKYATCIEIEKSLQLVQIHEGILDSLFPYFLESGDHSAFVTPPAIDPITIEWAEKFKEKKGHPESYYPHITIGFGTPDSNIEPAAFTTDTIAIYQWGNYGTCRKILAAYQLNA